MLRFTNHLILWHSHCSRGLHPVNPTGGEDAGEVLMHCTIGTMYLMVEEAPIGQPATGISYLVHQVGVIIVALLRHLRSVQSG